jgi:hypothetical protein
VGTDWSMGPDRDLYVTGLLTDRQAEQQAADEAARLTGK